MRGLADVVVEFPWRSVAGAFALGAAFAADRHARNTIIRASLEIGRIFAVQRARAWFAPEIPSPIEVSVPRAA